MLTTSELEQLRAIRHHLHRHPELSREEAGTAIHLAEQLRHLGLEAETGIGGHGLVATIRGERPGAAVGLRADMDALAITERTGLAYASCRPNVMHACGHDGHMAILLGAGMILSRRRDFAGRVHLIFQPAEERFGGARLMVEEGLLLRYPMARVFGLHNWPGLPAGQVVVHDGPVMAGTSEFTLRFRAEGGHASMPHLTGDPLLAGGHFMTGIQQAVARSVDPFESAVVTVGSFRGGHAQNIIPQEAELTGTLRGYSGAMLLHLRGRVRAVALAAAEMAGCAWDLEFDEPLCPPVVNRPAERDIMRQAALAAGLDLGGPYPPSMGGDDFGDLLAHLPGAYAFLGNGPLQPEAGLHQPKYDFNDAVIAPGAGLLALSARIALGSAPG
ncbi:MAG: amidohydrolase [Paracoccus sp. (in: a-proteobacteria)]|uniref:M20 metallopeptidase family protein n=1 Tax=Paracoccus sp. TaxID=267 RepID=UPI0039E4ED1B